MHDIHLERQRGLDALRDFLDAEIAERQIEGLTPHVLHGRFDRLDERPRRVLHVNERPLLLSIAANGDFLGFEGIERH